MIEIIITEIGHFIKLCTYVVLLGAIPVGVKMLLFVVTDTLFRLHLTVSKRF